MTQDARWETVPNGWLLYLFHDGPPVAHIRQRPWDVLDGATLVGKTKKFIGNVPTSELNNLAFELEDFVRNL